MDERYITVSEAAVDTDVSRATMWKWIKRHDLPTFRFMGDRKTYVQRADLVKLREPIRVDFQQKKRAA
jgi:excisionase family DNA binding protein